ncbi:MAG: alpha/beta hydrolase, partial [Bdellovibrionota bacterium]
IHDNRFDIPMLAERLLAATEWLIKSPHHKNGPIGYFGASTGAAAALMAAAEADRKWPLYAIVGRGGRPDLAGKEFLKEVRIPTLLIVGSNDGEVIKLNEKAKSYLSDARLVLVPGASHLFEEPGALAEVVKLSASWFFSYLEKGETHANI